MKAAEAPAASSAGSEDAALPVVTSEELDRDTSVTTPEAAR